MKIKVSLLSIFLLLSLSCSTHLPVYNPNVGDQKIRVVVKYFTVNENIKINYNGNINFTKQIAENIASLFQKNKVNAIAVNNSTNIDFVADYIIEGDVTVIDQGNRAARFWGGFGAGSAIFEANAKLIDNKTSKVILNYTNARTSFASVLKSDDNLMQELCLELSEDIYGEFSKPPSSDLIQAAEQGITH